MSRYTGAKNRVARRFGINIFGRKRNPLIHKPNPPGVHGARRRKKSEFGLQLEEKQKLKAIYGMLSEKQLLRYYKESLKKPGNTAHILAQTLECRLDNIVYHLGFASTIFGAHQLVSHGHILVNGKKVDRRSFQVKPGMTVSIKPSSQKMRPVVESLDNPSNELPEFLSLDREKFSGTLLAVPMLEQISWPIEVNLAEICDFLAHTK
ncbi:MAG: 30S ribosomal protein S4 [Chlamydiae bacterium]|nr:30S ribosomal protein S4 [Chlamydiota bacterium]